MGYGLCKYAACLGSDLVEIDPEALEDARRNAFSFAHEADEKVLCAYVVVLQSPGLVNGQLDDLLGPGGETYLPACVPLPTPDDELYGRPDLAEFHAQVGEGLGRHAVGFPHQAEKYMLGPDVVVIEPLCFLLRKGQDSAGPL